MAHREELNMTSLRRPPRRIRRIVPVVCIAALLTLWCPGSATAATQSLAGKWSGSYTGTYAGTLKLLLKQSGSKLHGSITYSSPKGTFGIHGTVRHGKVKFTVAAFGVTFTGTVNGTRMSGRWSGPGGSGRWKAHRVS
jgi:hypothetical protein